MTTKEDEVLISSEIKEEHYEQLIQTNETLLDKVHWRDVDLFNELLTVSTPITISLVTKYFMRGYETEDMMQEARFALLESVNTYDETTGMPFLKYYHMRLTNHFNMLIRREHTDKRKANITANSLDNLMEDMGQYIQGTSCVLTHPENVMIAKEAFELYMEFLSRFERKVYKLFMDGKTVKQIALTLECTETKVNNAWYRCTIKFKVLMN